MIFAALALLVNGLPPAFAKEPAISAASLLKPMTPEEKAGQLVQVVSFGGEATFDVWVGSNCEASGHAMFQVIH